MRLVLVHPPLLAPMVFSRLAPLLRASGHQVVVPDLREAITAGPVETWWRRAVDAAATAMPGAEAVVTHSGAGALVPPLLQRLAQTGVVLIDAVLAPASGVHATSSQVRAMVADLAVDGVLPPWTSWWPPGVLESEVPHQGDRMALAEAAPSLPVAFYDVDVPAPDGWEPASRFYLHLSPGYQAQAEDAAARGWHVEHLAGRHLDVLTRAHAVATAVHRFLQP